MKTINYHKPYGLRAGYYKGQHRWYVLADGVSTSLHYAKREFALKKAIGFIHKCHSPFIDFQGNQVTFTFSEKSQ